MDKQLQDYYENRFKLFSEQGWKDLIVDVECMLVSTNSLDGVDTEQKLHFRKGEISIINWLLSLQSSTEFHYEKLKEENK
jgi:hypothetical protein